MLVDQSELQKIIQHRLNQAQLKNPRFTLRAMAKKMELSSGALSEILSGKRVVASKLAQKICSKLDIDLHEKSRIFYEPELAKDREKNKIGSEEIYQLSQDQFAMLSQWPHFALLSLLNTKGCQHNVDWMAERLGLSKKTLGEVLARLLRLDLVRYDQHGKLLRTKKSLKTTDDLVSYSVRKSHLGDMELAKSLLDKVGVQHRDYTSISIPTDLKTLNKAKTLIRKFQDEMMNLLWTAEADQVYKMSVYLYPLTTLKEIPE
jgi:uncharacterized protein (TIGR02147 family)